MINTKVVVTDALAVVIDVLVMVIDAPVLLTNGLTGIQIVRL